MDALQIGDLRVKYPIVQGGMGVAISLAGLASAVANAGGIGVISAAAIGMREKDYAKNFREANLRALRKEIQKAKSLTNGVLGVNIMMALSDHEDLLVTAIKEGIDIAIMGAGLPLKMPQVIINAGLEGHKTKLAVKVSSGKAARLIFQSWANHYNIIPDAVVVEGPMAGGHLGFKPTELEGELVPLSTLVKIPLKQSNLLKFNSEKPFLLLQPVAFIPDKICSTSCKPEPKPLNWELALLPHMSATLTSVLKRAISTAQAKTTSPL